MPTATETHTPPKRRRKPRAESPLWKNKALAILSMGALIAQSSLLILALFEPPLPYKIPDSAGLPDSEHFRQSLAVLTSGYFKTNNHIEVLTNGEQFYEAELAAIRTARKLVHLECYIFHKGEVAKRFLDALTERAAAGVEVKLLVDAIGSTRMLDSEFEPLRKAGGRAAWYHPIRWYTWPRLNNRTHRELLVIDGGGAFVGGAGFDDQWLKGSKKDPRWRDTMVRVDGEAVDGLQATFAQNWLESTGEVLIGPKYFPFKPGTGKTPVLVVASSPTVGRATAARILFQTLVASARKEIHVESPYFLPDESLIGDLTKAIRERNVKVTVIVPGKKSDHMLTRGSSRRLYGDLLKAGARIFEYQPAMIHAKILIVDGIWSVAGSTNMDSRSFGLNDEVNVAIFDRTVAERLERDFQDDLAHSAEVSYEQWKRRPFYERLQEWAGALIERQQ